MRVTGDRARGKVNARVVRGRIGASRDDRTHPRLRSERELTSRCGTEPCNRTGVRNLCTPPRRIAASLFASNIKSRSAFVSAANATTLVARRTSVAFVFLKST